MNTGKSIRTQGGLEINYGPVTVDAILTPEDSARNGVETKHFRAQLRQVVTAKYPKARGNALFPSSAFGAPETYDEKRVSWLNVPMGTTMEQVTERLNALECPTLVRILDLKPILTQSQHESMEKGINTKTIDDYKEDFVRESISNEPVLYANHYQYRSIVFSESFADDEDYRAATLRQIIASQGAVQMAHTEQTQPAETVQAGQAAGTF